MERIRTGACLTRSWVVIYQNAMIPPPGRHTDVPVIPLEPEPCYRPSTLLRFSLLALTRGDLLCGFLVSIAGERCARIVPSYRLRVAVRVRFGHIGAGDVPSSD